MSIIYCIRHGQAMFGQKDYDRLSELGLRQARILGENLIQRNMNFDALYCGTLKRQQQTAGETVAAYQRAGRKLPRLQTHPAFDEFDAKALWKARIKELSEHDASDSEAIGEISTDIKAFQRVFEQILKDWIADETVLPQVRPWSEFKAQVIEGTEAILAESGPGKRIAVFTSAGPIAVLMQAALDLSARQTARIAWQLKNASMTAFKYRPDQLTLAGFNDVSHLELLMDEKLITYR